VILVFGKTGQVASELAKLPQTVCIGRDAADLRNPSSCADLVLRFRPQAVINAAAYTNVDGAEEDEKNATIINAYAPVAMAEICSNLDIPIVHISTDYVFDGSGHSPRNSNHIPSPLGAYGRSKLLGEVGILNTRAQAVILRTSWVFSANGKNFVKTMLSLSDTKNELSIVADQIGGPTSARSIAQTCHTIATQIIGKTNKNTGIYHFSGFPDVSWAEFAEEIFSQSKCSTVVNSIISDQYLTSSVRPLNSRLDCTKLLNDFGVERSNWKIELSDVLSELECQRF
jgi:dTDP-4-dehydrorhamnose reductase